MRKIDISIFSDAKLLSRIGMELHSFYYPEKGRTRNPNYLRALVREAENRDLSYSENFKGAKDFLEGLKTKQKENVDKDIIAHLVSTGNFFELAKKRQSIRKFSERKLPKEAIWQILKCAVEAPSSCNRQAWRFLVLEDQQTLSLLSEIRRVPFLKKASAVICVLVDKELYNNEKELNYTAYMDGAAAVMNIIYAAQSLNISSCWVNFGDLEISKSNLGKFHQVFQIQLNFKPISLVALGYKAQDVKKPKRELLKYYVLRAGNKIVKE